MGMIDNLLQLLARGQEGPLLRFSLGSELYKARRWEEAVEHLAAAVRQDPEYSAAWKLYGRALLEAGRTGEALGPLEQGIAVAERRGDLQAAKEMRVFLKRARAAQQPKAP
jgi:predicted Zn-dependent protease